MTSLRLCGVLLLLAAPSSFAQATRTWISGVGDDANPCSRTAPCATLAGTLTKTAAGGEINVLDAAPLGSATITSSITVAVGRELGGGMDSPSLTGLTINAPGGVVTLRGLSFEANQSGTSGLRVIDAALVRLERCRLNGFTRDAIDARVSDGGLLFIDDTSVRGSLGAGLVVESTGAPLRAVVSESSFTGNRFGLRAGPGAKVTVRDGVLAGNSEAGVHAASDGGVGAEVNVEGAQLTHNGFGVVGLSGAVVRLSNSNVTGNLSSPTHVTGSGLVHSFGNNRILGGSTSACVVGSVVLDPVTLPSAVVGVAVPPVELGSTGTLGAVTYGATGALPTGITIDGGTFFGTSRQTGVFPVTLTATDVNGCVASQAATFTVACPSVTVAPATLPQLTTGVPMTPVPFTLAGSTSTQTQAALTGALPIGLSFAAGVLSGAATQDGTFPLTVSVMDGFGCTAQAMRSLVVVRSATFQATTLALTTPRNPVPLSAPLTFTATLTFASGAPTGTVGFFEGSMLLGSAPLVGGLSVFTTSMLTLGNHRLTATYGGDATYGASLAPELSVDVALADTTTALSFFGDRLEVEVQSSLATPEGTVAVVIDGAAPVMATLDSVGRARVPASLTVGTHVAQARYAGAVRFAPSESPVISYTVAEPVVDAGAPMDVDAGVTEPMKPTGCGCSSADAGLSVFMLLALAWRRRLRGCSRVVPSLSWRAGRSGRSRR